MREIFEDDFDRLANELSESEIIELDLHLSACEKCRSEFREIRKVWDIAGNALKHEPATEKRIFSDDELRAILEKEEQIKIANSKRRKEIIFCLKFAASFEAVFIVLAVFVGLIMLALNTARSKAIHLGSDMEIEEKEFLLTATDFKETFDAASDTFKLAVCVAEFAEFLEFSSVPKIAGVNEIQNALRIPLFGGAYAGDGKVRELYNLIEKVK